MDRQRKVIVGSATGAFVIAAVLGVFVALQTSSAPGTASAAAATASGASPNTDDAPAEQDSTAPANPAACTIGEAGNAVQVTLVAPDPQAECASMGQSLAKSSGGFWQAEAVNGSLALVCVMDRDSVSATVLDDGGEILGHALCSDFEASGWSEDTAAENRILAAQQAAAAASAASASAAAKQAGDERAASYALSSLQQDTDNLTSDIASLKNDIGATDKDLTAERNDAAQGPGDQCVNASTTVYNDAATTIYNDEQTTLLKDVDNAGRDVASTRAAIAALQQADAALAADGLSVPSGASDAVSAAQTAVSKAVAAANASIDAVTADVSTAYQIADGMATGACADASVPGSPPSPLAHLS